MALRENKIKDLSLENQSLRQSLRQYHGVVTSLKSQLAERDRVNVGGGAAPQSSVQNPDGSNDVQLERPQNERQQNLSADLAKLKRAYDGLKSLSDRNYQTAKDLKAECIDLRSERVELMAKIEKLNEQLERKRKKIKDLKGKNAELKSENQTLNRQLEHGMQEAASTSSEDDIDADSEHSAMIQVPLTHSTTPNLTPRQQRAMRRQQGYSVPAQPFHPQTHSTSVSTSRTRSQQKQKASAAIQIVVTPPLSDQEYQQILTEITKVYQRQRSFQNEIHCDGPPPYKTTDWGTRCPMPELIRFCLETKCGIPDRKKPNSSKGWNWLRSTKRDIGLWIQDTPFGQKKWNALARSLSGDEITPEEKAEVEDQYVKCWKAGFRLKREDAAKMPFPVNVSGGNAAVNVGGVNRADHNVRNSLERRDSAVDFESKTNEDSQVESGDGTVDEVALQSIANNRQPQVSPVVVAVSNNVNADQDPEAPAGFSGGLGHAPVDSRILDNAMVSGDSGQGGARGTMAPGASDGTNGTERVGGGRDNPSTVELHRSSTT